MFSSAIFKKMFKPFFLVCLVIGYQSAALCATIWDVLLGGTAVAGLAYGYFNYRRYIAHKTRFKDHERILDIHDRLQELLASPLGKGAVAAYENALSKDRAAAIDTILIKMFREFDAPKNVQVPLSVQAQWNTFFFPEKYTQLEQNLAEQNAELKSFKKKLETKSSAWQSDAQKKLLVPQSEIVLKELARVMPVYELIQEELPYALALSFKETFGLFEAERDLAAIVGDPKEIKHRLEAQVRATAKQGEQYPYVAYYTKLQQDHTLLESVVAKFNGWTPKAYQEHLILQIKNRLIELSALCTYVKNTHEFVTEQRSAEAERRAREAERIAALALARELKAREDADRKEREAREKARIEEGKKQELKSRIVTLETTIAAQQPPQAPGIQQDHNARPSAPSLEDLN